MTHLDFTPEDFFKAISQPLSHITDSAAIKKTDSIHKNQCRGTHFKAEISDISAYFSPTLACFCKRPVHRYYTLEYGPILECASYDETKPFYNPRFICGFHVHEISWLRLFEQLNDGYSICSRYVELRTCPLFNFTYCALFKVQNDYRSIPVGLPTCFCGKSIKMVYNQIKDKHQERLQSIVPTSLESKVVTNFICANRNVQGAPKCNWLNPADKSVFPKPKFQLHTQIDECTYNERNRIIRNDVSSNIATLSYNR